MVVMTRSVVTTIKTSFFTSVMVMTMTMMTMMMITGSHHHHHHHTMGETIEVARSGMTMKTAMTTMTAASTRMITMTTATTKIATPTMTTPATVTTGTSSVAAPSTAPRDKRPPRIPTGTPGSGRMTSPIGTRMPSARIAARRRRAQSPHSSAQPRPRSYLSRRRSLVENRRLVRVFGPCWHGNTQTDVCARKNVICSWRH